MPVSIIIGGQYGSEGKGKIADFWAKKMNASAVVRVGGPNSGHTVYTAEGKRMAFTQIPAPCARGDALSILPAGSYIDIETLQKEIAETNLTPGRLAIDFNAMVVDYDCKQTEKELMLRESIGSTLSGTGYAVSKRVMRTKDVTLAGQTPELSPFIADTKMLMRSMLNDEKHIVVEGTQGYGLSNLHTQYFPYATSRDTSAAGFLSETGLSPFDVEHIVMVLRAFPIRVAGNSGPLPHEISWETLTEESGSKESLCEYTTVTRKIRRVARFDSKLVIDAITTNRPDVIILNHVDYFDMQQHGKPELSQRQLKKEAEISKSIGQQIDYVGNGPNTIFAVQKTT